MVNSVQLECIREYKYLRIVVSLNGSFTRALNDLYHRGQKAFLNLQACLNILSVLLTNFFSCLIKL